MNPYKVLGVKKNASDEEIHKAFKDLAKKLHPDIGGDEKEFKKINEAYQILSNKETKDFYDSFGFTEDSEKHKHYRIVTENMKSYLQSRFASDRPVIIEDVTEKMKELLEQQQSSIDDLEAEIAFLKTSKDNVKMKKKDKINCYQLAIDDILDELRSSLKNLKSITKNLKKSIKISENYKTVVKDKRSVKARIQTANSIGELFFEKHGRTNRYRYHP